MTELMVKQWSFCEKCKGRGCPECRGKGTTMKLIPLESLKGYQVRKEYEAMQADFIKKQREAGSV